MESSDYPAFVDLLANVSDMFRAQDAAFALMFNNHYHTAAVYAEGNINRIMRDVQGLLDLEVADPAGRRQVTQKSSKLL